MSSARQSKVIAAGLLSETSQVLSTLQGVQKELRAWHAEPDEPIRRQLRQSHHPSSGSGSRRCSLAELRQTIQASKKRINDVIDRFLKEIQAAEGVRNDRMHISPAQTNERSRRQQLAISKDARLNRSDFLQGDLSEHVYKVLARPPASGASQPEVVDDIHRQDESASLRYECTIEDLGPNMISTILKARSALRDQSVDERGYLILTTSISWSQSDLDQMLQSKTRHSDEYSKGFSLQDGGDGFHHIYRNDQVKVDCSLPKFESHEPAITPEQNFQASVDSVRDDRTCVAYLIGPHASDTEAGQKIGRLLDPGPVTSRRPDLPGINSPYWYVSYERGTPTTMHIEDGFAGSANMLLAGAEKHWLIIRRSSTQKLERCVRAEFGGKSCSQFLRHHHIIFSPRWLREREIQFDLACQRPGEIMITLPGLTYHEILNIGANFAIAINYEFADASSTPNGYNWCKRGRYRCGPNAIRLKDFQIPLEVVDWNSKEQITATAVEDVVEVTDDESYELNTFLRLPNKLSNDSRDVECLIKAAIDQGAAPHWFGCKDTTQLEVKLQQFRPGSQLSDDILQKLLSLIALRRGFHVVDSLTLDLAKVTASEIIADVGSGSTGIVLPFHVNSAQQSASGGRDHWVLAVLNINTNTFTSWGIDPWLATRWAEAFSSIDSIERHDLPLTSVYQHCPENPDGASCALCCCYALDTYLHTAPDALSPVTMRSHYLRKLLESYNLSTLQRQMIGRTTVAVHHSPDDYRDYENITTGDTSDMSTPIASVNAVISQCNTAFADESLPDNERKTRLIQLILQCCTRHLELWNKRIEPQTPDGVSRGPDGPSTIFALMKQIEDTSGMYLQALRSRFLLVKLHLLFESEVSDLMKQRRQSRIVRRRAASAGETLEPLPPGNGKKLRNAVMDRIIETIPGTETRSARFWRAKLTQNLQIGAQYYLLVSNLGLGLLSALPYVESTPYSLENIFPNNSISMRPISPSEYHQLSTAEADFFIKWFAQLNPDIDDWNRIDFKQLYMDESYWKEVTHLQAKVLENISKDLKRPHTSTACTAIVEKIKRSKI